MGSSNNPILPSPPPYSHLRHHRRYPRFLTIPLPLLSLICFIISIQFFILPRYVWTTREKPSTVRLNNYYVNLLDAGLEKCRQFQTPPVKYDIEGMLRGKFKRENPRWNVNSGQQVDIFLKNATLFDGESFLKAPVNILFHHGVITAITPTSSTEIQEIPGVEEESFIEIDLEGKFVTPGLVDMHSHHYVDAWPDVYGANDGNEMHEDTGPLTPFLRVSDGLKSWDSAANIIASGGVTTSMIFPGSANIMGGQGIMVKNALKSGKDGEFVVEEILLEHGINPIDRRRYMKMACGENPMRVYGPGRTRMGNAWKLRHQLERARNLLSKQDEWCLSAAVAKENGVEAEFIEKKQTLPEDLELESSVAILRQQIGVNIHCYETQDFEDMIRHANEFGFKIQAFHHALDAWKVPEMIKDSGMDITIATFSEFGLLKKEAYGSNLWAGHILSKHGVSVAYKSDHSEAELSAKYLLHQAATAHAFHLPEELALQSVTSVSAKSVGQDHRVGYARIGYDADLVVWDSHPLSLGATPLQVYIDGKATLDSKKVKATMPKQVSTTRKRDIQRSPQMKTTVSASFKEDLCSRVEQSDQQIVIEGISTSYLKNYAIDELISGAKTNLTMVLTNNKITCYGSDCSARISSSNPTIITLKDGHVLPGLTTVANTLGLAEMLTEESTTDGGVSLKIDPLNSDNVVYAKYGVHLEGVAFGRARIGGVTRAITAPLPSEDGIGFLRGVSVGFKTGGKRGFLDGGVFSDDVGLHFTLAQAAKGSDATPTISTAVAKLRKILNDNKGKDNIYGFAANGSIPLVIHAENKYDITQLIKIKQDYQGINLVIFGGSGAHLVAKELAEAEIPVILTGNRGGPDKWEKTETLVGPPLTRSAAAVLIEAGVEFGLAIVGMGDTHIHNLALEASWAAKYSGLSDRAAVDLVSRNIEKILDLDKGSPKEESKKDFVIWEGNPLEFGASVVLAIDGELNEIMECWPEAV